jgi:O-antigen ligase
VDAGDRGPARAGRLAGADPGRQRLLRRLPRQRRGHEHRVHESTDTRLELWEQTVELIPDYALIGAGPGLIETLGPGTSDRPFYAHNVFLDATVEVGILGALALLAVFLAGLTAAYRRRADLAFALIAAYVVAGLFDDLLYTPRNGLLLAAAFALIAGTSKPPSEPDTPAAARG